ncbi:DUF4765 family protein [Pseudomonas chlororaphis]|uniref:DUF4765 family protein n=1 Tax=Pseudomonas chlororaphis TaxID=587753 RepID=UPI0013902D6B|nr:DUF4765 family protein [Pseudomonas chlororaphis]
MYTIESMKKIAKKVPAYSQLDESDDDYIDDEHDDGPLPKELDDEYKTLDYGLLRNKISERRNPDEEYILYRGTSGMSVVNMLNNKSAGDNIDIETPAPSEGESKKQVGKGAFLPEFSTDSSVFDRFSRGRYGVVAKIKQRYLAAGSNSESGFVVNKSAPVKILEVYDRTFGKTELSLPNAS